MFNALRGYSQKRQSEARNVVWSKLFINWLLLRYSVVNAAQKIPVQLKAPTYCHVDRRHAQQRLIFFFLFSIALVNSAIDSIYVCIHIHYAYPANTHKALGQETPLSQIGKVFTQISFFLTTFNSQTANFEIQFGHNGARMGTFCNYFFPILHLKQKAQVLCSAGGIFEVKTPNLSSFVFRVINYAINSVDLFDFSGSGLI